MNLLIPQLIVTICTGGFSILALNKDLRSKNKSLKIETIIIRRIIVFVTIVSLANSILSYFNSESDKRQLIEDKRALNRNLADLKTDNTTLRQELTNVSISQSRLITSSQEQSATELKHAANNLHNLINGSNKVPRFNFVVISDTLIAGLLWNLDTLPVYNLITKITNYNNLEKCKTKIINFLMYDLDCYNNNTTAFPPAASLNAKSSYRIELPKFNSKLSKGKFLILIVLRNKSYYEEAIYSISEKHYFKQALRIIEVDRDKVSKIEIINDKNAYELKNVNWEKEFPLPVILHLRQF